MWQSLRPSPNDVVFNLIFFFFQNLSFPFIFLYRLIYLFSPNITETRERHTERERERRRDDDGGTRWREQLREMVEGCDDEGWRMMEGHDAAQRQGEIAAMTRSFQIFHAVMYIGIIKLNTNGSIKGKSAYGGFGGLLCDGKGAWVSGYYGRWSQ
ncbi:unnamed protein product [Camellia sinensis]